jgi:uncharacterized protein YgiM (DUF1202 family)
MRYLSLTVVAFAVAAALTNTAIAAPISNLSAPSAQGYQTVAATEMTVSVTNANLREKPTKSSKVLAKVPQGTKVMVAEMVANGKWAHVTFNNLDGYIIVKSLK